MWVSSPTKRQKTSAADLNATGQESKQHLVEEAEELDLGEVSDGDEVEEKPASEQSIGALKRAIESRLQLTELERELGDLSQQELPVIPKSKISKVKKRKKKKQSKAEPDKEAVPIALQKFSFVNTTQSKSKLGLGSTVQSKSKLFGESTLSNLGRQFPAQKSRIGDGTLSALSKEFSLQRLRAQNSSSRQEDDTLIQRADNIIAAGQTITPAMKFKQMRQQEKAQRKMMAGSVTHKTISQANARSQKLQQILAQQAASKATGSLGTMEALEAEILAQSQVSFDTNQFKVKSNSGSEQPTSQKKRGPLDSYEEFYSSEGEDLL